MKKLMVSLLLLLAGLMVFLYFLFASPVSVSSRQARHELTWESAAGLLAQAQERLGFSRHFLNLTSVCVVSEQTADKPGIRTIGFLFTRTLIPSELYQATYVCYARGEELVISLRDEPKELTSVLGVPLVHSQPLDGAGLGQVFENPELGERWLIEGHPEGYRILEIFSEDGDIKYSVMNKRVDLTLGQVLPELKRLYD